LPDTVTLTPEQVSVVAAWPVPEDGFCVIYTHPWYAGRTFGYRAQAESGDEFDDPVVFGVDVANFQISEPLGSNAERLRKDVNGVEWWGWLDEELPGPPGS
jgi:hypothetical protein